MGTKVSKLTAERARELLTYNRGTGALHWRIHRRSTMVGEEAGGVNQDGYRRVQLDGSPYYAHRVIWLIVKGYWPKEVDHQDGVRGNNCWSNLRETDTLGNNRNRRTSRNNSSGVTGVCWDRGIGKWKSYIYVRSMRHHLTSSENFDEVVAARKAAEVKYGFHQNHGRGK